MAIMLYLGEPCLGGELPQALRGLFGAVSGICLGDGEFAYETLRGARVALVHSNGIVDCSHRTRQHILSNYPANFKDVSERQPPC